MALKQFRRVAWNGLVPGCCGKSVCTGEQGCRNPEAYFVPVPDFIDAALANLQPLNEPLRLQLGAAVGGRMTGCR